MGTTRVCSARLSCATSSCAIPSGGARQPQERGDDRGQRRLRSARLIAGLPVDAITLEADPVWAGARGRVRISRAGQAWKDP
jgi:hypothetical protein